MTPELDFATRLAELGAPIFRATPGGHVGGFDTPANWQNTTPEDSAAALEAWRPGDALCMVTGTLFDVVDVDPRNGGNDTYAFMCTQGVMPCVYAVVDTPSGGQHYYVKTLGVPKTKHGGVDFIAGSPDGTGRGMVFLPGTVRPERLDRPAGPYRVAREYLQTPRPADRTGTKLVEWLSSPTEKFRGPNPVVPHLGDAFATVTGLGTPIPLGEHDETLFRYACKLRALNFEWTAAVEHVQQRMDDDCTPPWAGPGTAVGLVERVWATYEAGSTHEGYQPSVEPEGAFDNMAVDFWGYLNSIAVDLTQEPPPQVRHDWLKTPTGVPLLYEAAFGLVYGEPGTQKSFLCQHTAVQAAMAGARVVYLDFEDSTGTHRRVHRMTEGKYLPTLHLVDGSSLPANRAGFVKAMVDARPDLVVVDSAIHLMEGRGNNGDDALAWTQETKELLYPLKKAGATVLVIDHLPKAAAGRANSPTGTVQKRASADFMYLLSFDQGEGVVVSRAKDRHGDVTQDLDNVRELVPFMRMVVGGGDAFGKFASDGVRFEELDGSRAADPKQQAKDEADAAMLRAYRELVESVELEEGKSLAVSSVYALAGLSRGVGRAAYERLQTRGLVPATTGGKAQSVSVVVGS